MNASFPRSRDLGRRQRLICTIACVAIVACAEDPGGPSDPAGGEPDPPAVATVAVTPQSSALLVDDTIRLSAEARDSNGQPLADRTISWSSSEPDIASVDEAGTVVAMSTGQTAIGATSEGITGTALVTVAYAPVATVLIAPSDTALEAGAFLKFSAELRDARGRTLEDRDIIWTSTNPAVAAVSQMGLLQAVEPGATTVTAQAEGVAGIAAVTVVHAPVTLVGAGDIADCETPWDEATADLLDTIEGTVFTLGDNVYEDGTEQEYSDCYHPGWGRHRARTYPAVGNHEYHTPGATPHFSYFGARAGDPERGYYSYEAGAWKVIVLNSNAARVAVAAGSSQEQWLRAELAASDHKCTLAYWHHPRFSSGVYGDDDRFDAFWQALYEYQVELVLVGHEHHYERMARLDPAGDPDPENGIRQIIAGTGGRYLRPTGVARPGSEIRDSGTHGVLRLTLRHDSYEWTFLPIAGQAFSDAGSDVCR